MSTHDHDNDALPGDDELKALYRSLPRKEPSPELDRAVKRAAAQAVRATPLRGPTRWPIAVASVAMVVVAAGLGWRMLQQPASVPTSAAPASPSMAPPPPAAPAIAAAPQPLAPPPSETARSAPSPQPERENIRSAMKPKVVAHAAPHVASPAVTQASAPVPAMTEESIVAAPASPAPAAPIQAAPAPDVAADSASAGGTTEHQGYRAAAMKAMAAPAPMAAPDATASRASDTPSQELDKIRQLFALQRRDEALQRLAAFRKAHPDIALPDDLRAQLPDHE